MAAGVLEAARGLIVKIRLFCAVIRPPPGVLPSDTTKPPRREANGGRVSGVLFSCQCLGGNAVPLPASVSNRPPATLPPPGAPGTP